MISLEEFKKRIGDFGLNRWPANSALETLWGFDLQASREDLWSYVSDTARLNRDIGLNARTVTEVDGQAHVKSTLLGIPEEWIEDPWLWVANHVTSAARHFSKGVARALYIYFYIDDTAQSKRTVYVYFGWEPRNAFARFLLKAIGPAVRRKFAKSFAKIDYALAYRRPVFKTPPPSLTAAAEAKLKVAQQELFLVNPENPILGDRLCDYIRETDDMDIEPIRLVQLAREWNVELNALILTALHASRMGLLRLTWDVVCPHCRGPRTKAESLGDLPESASCDACDLTFKTDEPNAIEVTFHVHESIRTVPEMLFCTAEPNKKAHIKAQLEIPARETVTLRPDLKAGTYRLRFQGEELSFRLFFEPRCQAETVELHDRVDANQIVGPKTKIVVRNIWNRPVTCVLEDLWWEDRALRPAQVFAIPEFRELFSEEHLAANVKLFLGDQSLLFTDIVGSTNYYRAVGDAKAFRQVREHFQEVFQIVKTEGGVVVKTIGDAVMASFPSSVASVKAALAIQQTFAQDREDTPIRLRVSVHCGPVIAVQLNSGIDYFGNTVNFAAKIQAHAGSGEIAMSAEVFTDFAQTDLAKGGWPVSQQKFKGLNIPADVFVLQAHAVSKRQSA